ncbi:MAG: hypothetical protein E7376_01085 [Clostridiales bacterium]|nr:hypothetical protein [Clostridiales bacterium]
MILFPVMILVAWSIIIGLNVLINTNVYGFDVWFVVVATVVCTLMVIVIDGATAAIVRLLPEKWFNPFYKRFKVFKWEKSFYQKIGIKKWKDLVPELGQFTKFRKNKVEDPKSNEYIYRYLLEATYGRVGHFMSFFTGFLIIFIYPYKYFTCFALPVALVNILMNSMSWFILRYNTPKLIALYKYNEKTQARINA